MAVISRLRKHSGWLVALIGVSILGFILQDAFSSRGGRKAPKFGVINGQELKIDKFEAQVDNMLEQYQRAQGDIPLTEEDRYEIRSRVWSSMVSNILLEEACSNLGLKVSKAEMNDLYYGEFIHPQVFRAFGNPQTGQIDRQQIMMTINNFDQLPVESQKILVDLEKYIKEDRLRNKYYAMVANGFYMPTFYMKHQFELQNASRTAVLASMSYTDMADDQVELKDADYKSYYEKNKHLFTQEKSRAIEYVVFDVRPSEEDLAAIDARAQKMFSDFQSEENLSDFVNMNSTQRFDSLFLKKEEVSAPWDSILFASKPGTFFEPVIRRGRYEMAKLIDIAARPDSIKASHILISYKGSRAAQNTARTKEQAKALADSIVNEIRKGQADYAALAMQFSEDPSKEQGGDLGWFLDGTMVKPFNEACIASQVGEVRVVETIFGYHVVKVTDKTPNIRKVCVAFVYLPIEPSTETDKDVFTKANQFFSKIENAESMKTLAEQSGIMPRKVDMLQEMDYQIPGVNNARSIVRWAYDKKTKKGQVSKEIYAFENSYVVVALTDIREEGVSTLETLKTIPQFQYAVRNDKKGQILAEKLTKAYEAKKNLFAMQSDEIQVDSLPGLYFNAMGLGMFPYEPVAIGRAFAMKEGQTSKAIVGRSGAFIIQLLSSSPLPQDFDYQLLRMQYTMRFRQSLAQGLADALEKSAKISDNRAFYY